MYVVHVLQDSGISEKDRVYIESVVEGVYKAMQDVLSMEECAILFSANAHKVQPGEIFQSFLCDESSFYVFVNLDALSRAGKKEITANLTEHLYNGLYATARVRCMNLDADCGLREEVIGEGLSAHFVCEMTRRKPKPYYTHLHEEEVQTFLQAMRHDAAKDVSYEKWFRGSREEGIPSHTIHAVGFSLVDMYLKKTKLTSVRALETPATTIFPAS
ncbi:MAG: DUF2268 domain-containing putative Zn-dependent protease [Candidatus Kaiserbacteria bacterium]|nr:DUF2268 domain-containing putative Zn-dependent protease [Candidatus Kaiserbacteria bacterium]